MKKFFTTHLFFLMLALTCASPAFPYLVYFKNGSTMEVQSHRVEGDKVFLKVKSGEAAFDKEQIDLEKTQEDSRAYADAVSKIEKLIEKLQYAEAARLSQTLIAADPDDVRARYLHGVALIGVKRLDEAVYELMRVQEMDPNWPKVKTRLGDVYYTEGNYNEAIDNYLKALDEDPKDKEAHLGLGNCYAKQEMYEGAKTELTKAIGLRPDYAAAYATLGYVYYKKSEFDNAMAAVDKAIKMDSSLPEAYYYQGLIFGVLGTETHDSKKRLDYFDKSIESFRRATTLRKDFPEAHADLGVAFYSRGSVARAVEEFKLAIQQKPDMAVAHNNLAGIYLRQGYFREAVGEAKKAVSIEPNMVEAYFIMGNAYNNMKMYKEAARAYDKYLYYSPDGAMSDEVQHRLDRVLEEGGMKEPEK